MGKWLRSARHQPIAEQHQKLCQKLQGHHQYFGITGNSEALSRLTFVVTRLWFKWLRRRSHGAKKRNWEWFAGLLERFPLPAPIAVHSLYRRCANP